MFDRVIRGPSRFASSVPNRTHSEYNVSVVVKLNWGSFVVWLQGYIMYAV